MADDTAELHRLQQQVRATIKERIDLDQRYTNPDALRAATARALRDRDAVTSPKLEEARDKVNADLAALHKEWHHADQIARNIERLDPALGEGAPAPIRQHRDAIIAELPAARSARARIADRIAQAGLAGILPEEGSTSGQG